MSRLVSDYQKPEEQAVNEPRDPFDSIYGYGEHTPADQLKPWTPEPWSYSIPPRGEIQLHGEPDADADDDGRTIDCTEYVADMRDNGKDEANAARIVACVNSMQGISDPIAFVSAARECAEALRLSLPMAKGYAAIHPVGANVPIVGQAIQALAAFSAAQEPTP